ncbi:MULTISPECIES: RluA family pseudouridine synthase [unclassified Iodidimonas]|jgi:23S rRNA pseudouridine1911/1915/1917 synthase|uniref:RluA family pseudouridine synthase n=1 Tax=unclassified Iodidimonas TaxID=2626145 RepID=UPI0024823550|nr:MULTISPECIES: RluA family pseudouridine synthase [unclassified Iodidimonas]
MTPPLPPPDFLEDEADSADTRFIGIADAQSAPDRLDRWLTAHVAELTRSRIKGLIESGAVTLNGQTILNPSASVKPQDRISLDLPQPEAATPQPQNIPLDIVYEDQSLIVINKPVGMVVHPAPGAPDGTLVNALLYHCADSLSGIGGVRRPGIVHRIDKDTSGLLVVAKTDQAHQGLAAQFAAHDVERRYIAFTRGHPPAQAGRIEGAIGRHPVNRKKMAVVERGGKHAITHYQMLAAWWVAGGSPFAAKVECRLETGRTHQVRVHMAHIGTALIGDALYGRSLRPPARTPPLLTQAISSFKRQALHAADLGFIHPENGQFLKFSSPLPYDMDNLERLLERFGSA